MKTKQFFTTLLIFAFVILSLSNGYAQSVGINSTGAISNPTAMLHVDVGTSSTKGLLVTGTATYPAYVPNLGAGSRLMFYPGKAAFRVGFVIGAEWDDANVGYYSTAMGGNTIALGNYSTAMGSSTVANGPYSTAMGLGTISSGFSSTAMGDNTTASGNYSTAMGSFVNTNFQTGAFIIGDNDPNNQGTTSSGFPDEFVARFSNGYFFLTSGEQTRFGVRIAHNGNAWLTICDKTRKENFEQLDGEDVLQKISRINFTSWNYKQQDPKIYRYYGIMAQDFYSAFGHDRYGTIGNDTTVNPIDMIGIDMTAIQALEKRTEKLTSENIELKERLDKLEKRIKNK